MFITNSQFAAVVSFYGLPTIFKDKSQIIPKYIPVQAHFGELDEARSFSDFNTAQSLKTAWDNIVQNQRRILLKEEMRLNLDEQVFFYNNVGVRFSIIE